MHILIVEDDSKLFQYLADSLRREGYSTEHCTSVSETEAYMAAENEIPDIIILDRMLGREDGASLIPNIKTRYPKAGILVLSALDMASEKARIIDSGADEYLSKPFSLEELTARLRLIARRTSSQESKGDPSVRLLGNLSVDFKSQQATVGGHKLDLTRKEFQTLSLLIDKPGRVYNRFQILNRVWEISADTESNVVESTIKNLRRKLEEAKCSAQILSRRNVGYWIEA